MTKQTGNQIGSIVVGLLVGFAFASSTMAQSTGDKYSEHSQHQQNDQQDLQEQIRAMQAKIANLEAALKQNHSAMGKSGQDMTDMKGMDMKKMSGMDGSGKGMKMGMGNKKMAGMNGDGKGGMDMKMGRGGMSGMPDQGQGMSGKGMKMMGKGMMMMGKIKSMGDMEMPSSLPGFPGASHIYHVGADGFFLDHSEHITLTSEQQAILNKLKEETLLKQADFDRQIEAAEQQLWLLTSSDSPDAKQTEDKIQEIANLQALQRIAYIRSIGEAAKNLTEEQRTALTGSSGDGDNGK